MVFNPKARLNPRQVLDRRGMGGAGGIALGGGGIGVILLLAAISAAAPVAGWTIVGDAIDNGIRAGDDARLVRDVVAYVAIGVVFPAAGCWEVTGTAGSSKLTFITRVRE